MDKDLNIWHVRFEYSNEDTLKPQIYDYFFDSKEKAKERFKALRQMDIDELKPEYNPELIEEDEEPDGGIYYIRADEEEFYEACESGNYTNHTTIFLERVVLESNE